MPRTIILTVIGLFFAIVATGLIRSRIEASRCYRLGAESEAGARHRDAYRQYGCAVSWRSPADASSEAARHALEAAVANTALPDEVRFQAAVELRRGLAASEHLLNSASTRESIAALDRTLEELSHVPPERIIREVETPRISRPFQLVAQVAFWLWIGFTLLLIARGFTADGTLLVRRAAPPLFAAIACYLLWLLMLSRA